VVLIGGQALNYWCDRYSESHPEIRQHGPFASKDIDFQADRALVPWVSKQVGGRYTLSRPGDPTFLNGVVMFKDSHGAEQRIDFVRQAYGLSATEVVEASAPVTVQGSRLVFGVKIMHPLHCLKSRVHNVVGLPAQYANDHGFRQLKAAIACMRLFIEDT